MHMHAHTCRCMCTHTTKYSQNLKTTQHQQEIDIFDFLFDGLDFLKRKSVDNAHQFIIYVGIKEQWALEKELKKKIKAVDYLVEKIKLIVGDIQYKIEPVLVWDMVCLVQMLSLYNCFCSHSYWRCAWCMINKFQLFDFIVETWPLQDLAEMRSKGAEVEKKISEAAKRNSACTNYAI